MENLNKCIEHTLLKQDATRADLKKICEEAINYGFFGVCVHPINVRIAKEFLKNTDIKVVTVVGFPLGLTHPAIKRLEANLAIREGADEIDMVMNVSALKDKNYNFVMRDIKSVVDVSEKPVKVIIETDLLDDEEIVKASEIVAQAGAKFIKTSTGFVKDGVGAKVKDVKAMAKVAEKFGISVKASGGIKTYKDAVKLIKAGATRLGTSSGVKIIEGANIEG